MNCEPTQIKLWILHSIGITWNKYFYLVYKIPNFVYEIRYFLYMVEYARDLPNLYICLLYTSDAADE